MNDNKIQNIVFNAIKETADCKYTPKSIIMGAIEHTAYKLRTILTLEEKHEAEKLMIETLNKLRR